VCFFNYFYHFEFFKIANNEFYCSSLLTQADNLKSYLYTIVYVIQTHYLNHESRSDQQLGLRVECRLGLASDPQCGGRCLSSCISSTGIGGGTFIVLQSVSFRSNFSSSLASMDSICLPQSIPNEFRSVHSSLPEIHSSRSD
jgi:hypothetical protein